MVDASLQLARRFVTGDVYEPYHSVGMVDSRMWDPAWRDAYGGRYRMLVRIYAFVLGDSAKAQTMASGESYWWGARGGAPTGMLTNFTQRTTVEQTYVRLRRIFTNLMRGDSFDSVLRIFGDPVPSPHADRPASP